MPPARSTNSNGRLRQPARTSSPPPSPATLAPVAAQHCAQDCIQVHGGIGFTWEHDTNVYYRRAIVLAACFGRAADYPQQVVDTATDHRHASSSTSTWTRTPRSCARRSAPKSLR